MSMTPASTPAIFLMGATACGKTALSVSLANAINAEIISVDSALVYKGMDIGTAKPTLAEQAGIPHHLIDICDAWQSYSAAQFCDDTNALIKDIHSRGKRALLVGGTMLYFKALEEGLAELPEADASIREALALQAATHGWQSLHDELQAVDPLAAERIHPNDPQRLQRALEVYRLTGTPLSELQANTRSDLAVAPVKFALVPGDRTWLHARIEQRFRQMVAQNFLGEVQRFHDDKRVQAMMPSMRSVGYRQAWEHLDRIQQTINATTAEYPDPESPDHWVQKAMAATRQLAKRQLTWLRSMSNVIPIECDTLAQGEQLTIINQALLENAQNG